MEGDGGSARGKTEGAARGREGMLYAYFGYYFSNFASFPDVL